MALFSGANRYPLPHGDGRSEDPISVDTWRKLWKNLERLRWKRGDVVVGTIRLVTSKEGSWLLTDHNCDNTLSVCGAEYRRYFETRARKEERELLYVYYDPAKRYWQENRRRGLQPAALFR